MSMRQMLVVAGWAMIVAGAFTCVLLVGFAGVTLGGALLVDEDMGVMVQSVLASAWPACAAAALLCVSGLVLRRLGQERLKRDRFSPPPAAPPP